MPSISIYIPDELYDQILEEVDDVDRDGNFSPWIQHVIRRELEGEYNSLEELTKDVDDLKQWQEVMEEWRTGVMADVIDWFTSEFGPPDG